jgi:hypothetical protein
MVERISSATTVETVIGPSYYSWPTMYSWRSHRTAVGWTTETDNLDISVPPTDEPISEWYTGLLDDHSDTAYVTFDPVALSAGFGHPANFSAYNFVAIPDLLETLVSVRAVLRYLAVADFAVLLNVWPTRAGAFFGPTGPPYDFTFAPVVAQASSHTLPSTGGAWAEITVDIPLNVFGTTDTALLLASPPLLQVSAYNIPAEAWGLSFVGLEFTTSRPGALPLRQRQRRDGLKSAGRGRQASSRQATNRGRGYW